MSENNRFEYSYSASEQEEIKKIREKYTAKTQAEDKMERLRRLDSLVSKRAGIVAIVLGIIGSLILGIGMSLIMTDLGAILGITAALPVGIIIGVVGGIIAGVAYPVYTVILKANKEKYAPEILRLADELMQ